MTISTPADPWPALPNVDFAPTRQLLHMVLQAVGKLQLAAPFQAQWAEVPLWLTARGLTTGPIPHGGGAFEVSADLIAHELRWTTSDGAAGSTPLEAGSVAGITGALFDGLRAAGIAVQVNPIPQEVADPVAFDQDTAPRPYDAALVTAWWRILLSTQRVMQAFQGRFTGKTQPIGLMWGTLDIRVPFYNGKPATPQKGYIRRNAMNAELIEMGWWSGDANYPKPAFYAFTYPQPDGIEAAAIGPSAARWDNAMGEYLLDYDDLRRSGDPDRALLTFLETTYAAGARLAGWEPTLLGTGRPE